MLAQLYQCAGVENYGPECDSTPDSIQGSKGNGVHGLKYVGYECEMKLPRRMYIVHFGTCSRQILRGPISRISKSHA